ncbi:hypothetical protein OQ279_08095 [Salinimicrobium sp. MT39]|uniref:Uncharacterized protein n=1 Tax=Salinimicrobium profundisediminis TaxID=2994553 RepID=A0A9X3I116_9FLAO|nr:hypothetical protein [Salinimicrobium profundisediminis]MCX2838114.1 hypothetical protein [Salinimicrobium profundisediminis]
MKKMILLFTVFTTLGCTGVKTTTSGLENEAFLIFLGNPKNYESGVEVSIDDNTSFSAEVQKDHSDRPKGKVYAISTGSHNLSVLYNGEVIYQKKIFVSTQETKKIKLP